MIDFILAFFINLVLFTLLYLFHALGIEGAMNIFSALYYFGTFLALIVLCGLPYIKNIPRQRNEYKLWQKIILRYLSVVMLCVLIWYGHWLLVFCTCFSWVVAIINNLVREEAP